MSERAAPNIEGADSRLGGATRVRALTAAAVLAPVSAVAIGLRRSRTLRDGDCSTAGPWDCGYDGTTAFAVALAIGAAAVIAVAAVARLTRTRARRAGALLIGVVFIAWTALAITLYIGAGDL
jgi:hypothetical protein